MRWLLYALGGGLGHVTRALALGRAAARRGIDCTLVTNTAWAPLLAPFIADEPVDVVTLAASLDRTGVAEAIRALLGRGWDALIVDVFPRGLGGELSSLLPRLGCPRILVHRDVEPRYIEDCGLRSFVSTHYDHVLCPGEMGPLSDLSQATHTAPWLIRDAAELLAPAQARAVMGATSDRPLVLVSGAGRPEESRAFEAIADQLRRVGRHEVVFSALGAGGHYPLLERLRGVDALVGAGGYHTVYETRATGVPLVGLAQTRLYDRQRSRLGPSAAPSAEAALAAVARATLNGPRPPGVAVPYENGVHAALDLLTLR